MAVVVAVIALAATFPGERTTAAVAAVSYPPVTDQQRFDLDNWWKLQPVTPLPIPADGAKVVIVKFSDYMCPACRITYPGSQDVLAKYLAGGNVRYVVKHYPLEAECSPAAPSNHYASCEAAAAVIMARSRGTADALEQWVFANQETLTPAAVKQAARDIGRIEDFDQQYANALREVRSDVDLGTQLKVQRTPTFYINGRKIDATVPPPYFDYLIEIALRESAQPNP
jgi:protein-disulfide isomerase